MTTDNSNLPPEPEPPLVQCPCCTTKIPADKLSIWGMFLAETEPRLSTRAYNVLKNANIQSAAHVARMSLPEILRCKNSGKKALDNILAVIDSLELSQYREDWLTWDSERFLQSHPEYLTTKSI